MDDEGDLAYRLDRVERAREAAARALAGATTFTDLQTAARVFGMARA